MSKNPSYDKAIDKIESAEEEATLNVVTVDCVFHFYGIIHTVIWHTVKYVSILCCLYFSDHDDEFCMSDEKEPKGKGNGRQHPTGLEEAAGWTSLPERGEEEEGRALKFNCRVGFYQGKSVFSFLNVLV